MRSALKGLFMSPKPTYEELEQKVQELRQSEERYRTAIENSIDGFALSRNGRYVHVNRTFLEMFGYQNPEEIEGRKINLIVHPEDRHRVAEIYRMRQEGIDAPNRYQFKGIKKDKTPIFIEISATKSVNKGQEVIIAYFRDITKRLRTEEKLIKSNAEKRAILDGITTNLAFVDESLEIKWVNKASADSVNISSEDMIGHKCYQYWGDSEKPCDNCPTIRSFRTKKTEQSIVNSPDGKVWDEKGEPVFDSEGKVLGVLEIAHDVTEKHKVEIALKESEERYRSLFENAQVGLFRSNIESRKLISCNDFFAQHVGYRNAHECCSDYILTDHYTDINRRRVLFDILRQKGFVTDFELQMTDKNGNLIYSSMNAKLYPDKGYLEGAVIDITDRKKTEEALKESDLRYKSIFDSSLNIIYLYDLQGNIIDANKAALELTGYEHQEITKLNMSNILCSDEMPKFLSKFDDKISTGFDEELTEYQIKTKQGDVKHTETRASLIYKDNQTYALQGIALDITERKNVEKSLSDSEAKYRFLTDKMTDIVWTMDTNFQLTYVSPSVGRILGFSPEERMKQSFEEQVTPESLEHIITVFQEELERDKSKDLDPERAVTIEVEYYNKDKSTVWMENIVSGIRNQSDELVGIHGVSRDISDRKRAEETLMESTERYKKFIENAPIGMYTLNMKGEYTYANNKLLGLTGYDLMGFLHKSYHSIVHPEDLPLVIDKIQKRMENLGTTEPYEIRIYKASGEIIWIKIVSESIYDKDNQLVGMQSFVEDISERKQAEEELKKRTEFIETTLDNLPIGIAVNRISDSSVSYINKKFEEIYGWPQEELKDVGTFLEKVYPGQEELIKSIAADIASADPSRMNWNNIAATGKNGEQTIIQASNIPLIDQDLMISTVQDDTDRKKAEDELKNRNEFIELILDNLPIGIAVNKISDQSITYANKSYEKIYGWAMEEVVDSDDFFQKVYPEQEELKERVIADILSGDLSRMQWSDLSATGKDGSQKNISAMNIPLIEQDLMISTAQDTTERYNAEKQLIISEERFRQLAEMLPETIYETDRTGNITFANNIAYDIFMYTEEDFNIGVNAIEMVAPEDRKKVTENIFRILDGHDVGISEYMAIKKDGAKFPVIIRSSPIYLGDEIIGLRGFMVDMTDQKALESQLSQAEKMQSIGTLAGGIAHDFNNILSIILGNTELALDDIPDWNPAREYLIESKTASLRAKDLVQQLLTFTRKSEEKQKPVNISTIAKESLRLLRSTIPTNIEIKPSISDDIHTINADLTQIHQILMNLVTNSAHAIEGRGTIDLELQNVTINQKQIAIINELELRDYIKLTVKDSGSGIDPQDLEKVFDPYFTTKEFGKGTGMGLSLVHGIVESHDGSIKLDSKVGEGTTISIYFPASEDVIEPEQAEEESDLSHGSESILSVDDERPLGKLIKRMLENYGYSVECRTDPLEALKLIRSNPDKFDLIITDMAMPKMTGDQLAREIQKVNPDLPVILCTGYSDNIDEATAKDIGIKSFLMKPFDTRVLADTVRKVLDAQDEI
jgi:PAS domain S-box-containing protein